MKVNVVMPLGERRGGGELMLLQLIREAKGLGIYWTVTFLEHGPMVSELAGLGAEVRVLRSGRLRDPYKFGRVVIRLARETRRDRTDVLFGWMAKAQLYTGLAGMLSGVPSAWYQLGMPSGKEWVDRIATRLPSIGVLTCSSAAANAQACLRPSRRTMIVYPGADLGRFNPIRLPTPAQARRRLGLPSSGPVIGVVGRLQQWKGMHLLVEAMPALLRSSPALTCVIVGGVHDLEPHYPEYLRSRINQLGLKGRIVLAGLQHNVPEWMQAMDIVVHASANEPFGIVLVEAMALGKTVVASANGGPIEVITDGVDGLLWPHPEVDGLVASLRRALENPALARRVGDAARERALHFSSRVYAENFVGAIHELLKRPSRVANHAYSK